MLGFDISSMLLLRSNGVLNLSRINENKSQYSVFANQFIDIWLINFGP